MPGTPINSVADLSPYASLLKSLGYTTTEELVGAAWLHDVVEDTPVTLDRVREETRFVEHLATEAPRLSLLVRCLVLLQWLARGEAAYG